MHDDPLVFAFFVIFTGAAALATLALYARQTLIVAYIVLGMIMGPGIAGVISDISLIRQSADIGIMFLLFLLGLELRPSELMHTFGKISWITLLSSLVFIGAGGGIGLLAGFSGVESLLIGAALIFSSTILGLKLLPTTVLHHQHMGRIMIGILLLQDLIAVGILLLLESLAHSGGALADVLRLLAGIPVLAAVALLVGRFVLARLFLRFDTIREYLFLVTVGWCLGMAELAAVFGYSHEIGAFVAGVTLAASPISEYIAETLRPLRDFFLVVFFFSLGAAFKPEVMLDVWLWALVLAAVTLALKPPVFHVLFRASGEDRRFSFEMGVRLGQISEFSLLVAVLALDTGVIGERASYLIQTATVAGFIVSSYWIVLRYPTPIAVSDRLRRD
jgi:Kef-type K+ transport system membrane component KefB